MKEHKKEILDDLVKVFVDIDNPSEMEKFLKEIFTEKELEKIMLRWHLMQKIFCGMPQRSIAKELGISLCKITRGSKILKDKNSISGKYLKKSNLIKNKEVED